jgi:hypothetical protein
MGDLASIGINGVAVQNKMGGGGVLEMVTKEEIVTKEEMLTKEEMVVVAKGKLRRSRWPRRGTHDEHRSKRMRAILRPVCGAQIMKERTVD